MKPDFKTNNLLDNIVGMAEALKDTNTLQPEDSWTIGEVYTKLWLILYNRGYSEDKLPNNEAPNDHN